jgi:hypothetical protein
LAGMTFRILKTPDDLVTCQGRPIRNLWSKWIHGEKPEQ